MLTSYDTNNRRKVKCSVCGTVFYTSHPRKKTCSLECGLAASQVAKYELKKNNKRYYKSSKGK